MGCRTIVKRSFARGIVAHVYRPGNVVSGSPLGFMSQKSNHTLLRFKGMLQLEKGFVTHHEKVEMMPVDLLSSSIIGLL